MNYERLYFAFINKYKNQEFKDGEYTEVHHIIPRHAGGGDSKENLIRLTYKQHIFAHRLLWKTYHKASDYKAWVMMSKQEVDSVLATHRAIGMANVESGHLERIRPLANTPERQEKLRQLNEYKVESGLALEHIKMAQEAWTGNCHTEEFKTKRSEEYKVKYSDGIERERILQMQQKANKLKAEKSLDFSDFVIQNAERNEEFLHKTSSFSKNIFISPEGLEFQSPIHAAKYYGKVEPYTVDNWCKRKQHGWNRKPKAA